MLKASEIEIALTTDDGDEAFFELVRQRGRNERGWDMAEVRFMSNPPRTTHRYCVFRNKED